MPHSIYSLSLPDLFRQSIVGRMSFVIVRDAHVLRSTLAAPWIAGTRPAMTVLGFKVSPPHIMREGENVSINFVCPEVVAIHSFGCFDDQNPMPKSNNTSAMIIAAIIIVLHWAAPGHPLN
jgi:hypothetical protein